MSNATSSFKKRMQHSRQDKNFSRNVDFTYNVAVAVVGGPLTGSESAERTAVAVVVGGGRCC